jgi:molybdenum cofactor cytidylyltransferase
MSRTFVLIPAAGKSSRMGKPKLALPLGERTVLERVLLAMKQAGIADRLVIVGPQAVELEGLAQRAGAHIFRMAEDTPDMQATVLQGLGWLESHLHPGLEDSWLLMPADHPTLDPAVVTELLKARSEHPSQSIFIPTHAGRRGHPALISWNLVADLREFPAGQGLNRFLREHSGQTLECPLDDPDVLCDLDTPEDYRRLLERFRSPNRIP